MFLKISWKFLNIVGLQLILVAFFSQAGYAQLKNFKKGLTNFDAGFYDLAIKEFEKVKNIDAAQIGNLNFKIAESFRLTNRTLAAIPYYEKALANGLQNSDAVFNYAFALKANEEYDKAAEQFKKYLTLNSTNKVLMELANREVNTLKIVNDIKSKKSETNFRNLSEINTSGAEFSALVNNGELIYASSNKDKIYANGLPYLGLYKRKINADLTNIGSKEIFSHNIYDQDRNEASISISGDGKTLVFARGNTGKRRDFSEDVDLYMSRFVPNEGWTEPKYLPISDTLAWDGAPAFSRDGKTLYFCSNRAGGSGGVDIYRVNMDASGRFGNPANMGKVINTAGDEMFPFVSADGKMYFSSNGHPGLGKLDLFVATREDGKTVIENMGLPYNSAMDDFGLSIDENENMFFSSNRAGGKGDDDIYFYQAPKKPEDAPTVADSVAINVPPKPKAELKIVNYFLKGYVFTNEESKTAPADSANVKIFKIDGGVEELVFEGQTEGGKFGPLKVDEQTDYSIMVDKNNYLIKREGWSMLGKSIPYQLLIKPITDTTFIVNIKIEPIFVGKTFKIENIYYDFDKSDIRKDAAVELDKLVQILNDNPKINIELGSHTDSQGSDLYNIRLSQRRAESVVNYLILKGINKNRLSAKGYGETELIISNAKDDTEHQINRRTEFKIVDILESLEEK